MSKVCHFLHLSLPLIILMISYLAISPIPTLAVQEFDYKGVILSADQDIKPITIETKSVNFTITAPMNNFFDPNIKYLSLVWKNSDNGGTYACFPPNGLKDSRGGLYFPAQVSPTGNLLTITFFDSKGCTGNLGTYHIKVFSGNETIFPDYRFEIEQLGGGKVGLKAINSNLGPTDTPQVMLLNAREKSQYELWWEGSGVFVLNLPDQTYPKQNDNILLDIPKEGIDFSTPGIKTLCMEIGRDVAPFTDRSMMPNIKCRFSVEFNFQSVVLPTSPPQTAPPDGSPNQCELYAAHVPEPAKSDSLSAGLQNVKPNQKYTIKLTGEGKDISIDAQANGRGWVSGNLIDHIDIGSYTVTIVDPAEGDKVLCTRDFKVTEKGSDKEAAKFCLGDKCAVVGKNADCSDARGPALKTAIGCIHTGAAELAKDVMTFVIGISGGLAFLMMLMGAFQILSSADNPDTLKAGRERLTSGVLGLLLVIFAILLFQIIGIGILNIPGLNK